MTQQATQPFLQQLIGTWTYSFRTADSSEYPGATATGTETVQAISEHFILLDNSGQSSDGSTSRAVTMIGHDPEGGLFSGAVATTAVPALFVYRGALANDNATLTLETEGPAMTPGQSTDRYRDIFAFTGPDHRYTAAEVFQDGAWTEFMRTEYARVG